MKARLLRILGILVVCTALLPANSTPAGAQTGNQGGQQQGTLPLPGSTPPPKLVLAFYYSWYGSNSWDANQMSDLPTDFYSSDQPNVIDKQIQEAQKVGIDGFISSWTGQDQEVAQHFPLLLDRAAQANFQVSVYFEVNSIIAHGDLETQVKTIIDTYQSRQGFLHWNDKPVFFFWRPEAYSQDKNVWKQLRDHLDPQRQQIWSVDTIDVSWLDVFDTIHLFSAAKWDASTDDAAQDANWRKSIDQYNQQHGTHRLWTAGVTPGWDERKDQAPGHTDKKYIPRNDGQTYENSWRAAIASTPEWITITSWNEWLEGSQIEPSRTYGNKYLDLTRKWVDQYKAGDGPAEVEITNFTLLNADHPALENYDSLDSPVVYRQTTLWIHLARVGGKWFTAPEGGGNYQIQVLVRKNGKFWFENIYSGGQGKHLDSLTEDVNVGKDIHMDMYFFEEAQNVEVSVYFMPDNLPDIRPSVKKRSLKVLPNPDNLLKCLGTITQQAVQIGEIFCKEVLEGCAEAAIDLIDLGSVALKCGTNKDCLNREAAAWAIKHVGGNILGVIAETLNDMQEPPSCTILVDFVTALLANALHKRDANGIMTQSPVYPLVVNDVGQRAGFLPNGQQVTEIPDSHVAQVGEKRFVFYYGTDHVTIEIAGYATGAMEFSAVLAKGAGTGINIDYKNVSVTSGMRATLDPADPHHLLNIDNNGDGQVDQTRNPDGTNIVGSVASTTGHTFAETNQTVDGRFWEVWQSARPYADSLYINGLPLTDKHEETSLTDGKVYKVQWFERARFEEHPENQAPYDVLLGLLGVQAAKGRSDTPFQGVANPGGRMTWFPQTKHTLGDASEGGQAIARFWRDKGGLAQFGYPLSQPFMEPTRETDPRFAGKSFLVQYFERQRFEYHPENKGTPFEVLLGRLGAEQQPGARFQSFRIPMLR